MEPYKPSDFDIRQAATQFALAFMPSSPEVLVGAAKMIEAYLRGEDSDNAD